MRIIVSGSLAYDRIMDFPGRFREHILPDKIHLLNVSFVLEKFAEKFGGTAGNIAYNLRLLDEHPAVIGAVGRDFRPYFQHLSILDIDTRHIKSFNDEYTAVAHIITDLDDNQISAFYPGAGKRGSEIDMHPDLKKKDNLLIVSPSSPAEMIKRCLEASQAGMKYIFDPAQQLTAFSAQDLAECAQGAFLLVFNDYEWQFFKSKTNLDLNDFTAKNQLVVVTQGEEGSTIYTPKETYDIPAARCPQVADPTGAGDAYRAGLALAIKNGWDWPTTGRAAATIASFAVEEYGTQEHKFGVDGFNERYFKNFGEKSPLA